MQSVRGKCECFLNTAFVCRKKAANFEEAEQLKRVFLKTCIVLIALTLFLGTFTVAAAQGVGDAVIRLTNAERERHGLPALRTDSLLNELAAIRAREIVGQSNYERARHIRPNGQTVTRWILDEGSGRFTGAGENSAFGTTGHIGSSRVMDGWMASTGHRRNILGQSANFTHIGVGFYSDGVNDFWVQLFAIERSGAANQAGGAQQAPAAPPAAGTPAAQPPRVSIPVAPPAAGAPAAQPPRVSIPIAPPAAGALPVIGAPAVQTPAAGISIAPPAAGALAAPSGAGAAVPRTVITTANATAMTQQAAQSAAPGAAVVVSAVNQTEIELAAMQAVAAAAGGRSVRIHADTRTGAALDVRIVVTDPSAATRGINLAASTNSASAVRTRNLFSRSFDGAMMVISMEQQGDFGMEVRVVAMLDTALDADNLFFYSFNRETNTFRRFTPSVRVDDSGFLHFNTTLAGDIIISNTQF